MQCHVQPYEGDAPYLFFSFSHKDEPEAYTIIERLTADGYRVWFDDGLHPGDEWPDVIAEHIYNSAACMIAVSPAYMNSSNCKNELTYANNCSRPMISVILEPFGMTRGMRLQIGRTYCLRYDNFERDSEEFYTALESAAALLQCREHGIDPAAIAAWREHTSEYRTGKKKKPPISGAGIAAGLKGKTGGGEIKGPDSGLGEVIWNPKQGYREEEDSLNVTEVLHAFDPLDETHVKEKLVSDDIDEDDPFGKTIAKGSAFGESTVVNKRKKPPVPPTIAILIRLATGEIYEMKGEEISIGRDKKQSNYVIENPGISRHHADIMCVDGKFFLRDAASTNGTRLHGDELGEEAVELLAFDEFLLDDEHLLFASGEKMQQILACKEKGFFATLTAVDTGETRILGEDGILLDRGHQWEGGVLGDLYISRKNQAKIVLQEDGFTLVDLGSTNGTSLNDTDLNPQEPQMLSHGDRIKVVDTPFQYAIYLLHPEEKEENK